MEEDEEEERSKLQSNKGLRIIGSYVFKLNFGNRMRTER